MRHGIPNETVSLLTPTTLLASSRYPRPYRSQRCRRLQVGIAIRVLVPNLAVFLAPPQQAHLSLRQLPTRIPAPCAHGETKLGLARRHRSLLEHFRHEVHVRRLLEGSRFRRRDGRAPSASLCLCLAELNGKLGGQLRCLQRRLVCLLQEPCSSLCSDIFVRV